MSKEIKDLRVKQNEIITQARSYLDQITDDMDPAKAKELEERYDAAMADYDKIEERIKRLERVEQAEQRFNERGNEVNESRRPDNGNEQRGGEHSPSDEEQRKPMTPEEAFVLAIRFGGAALPAEVRQLLTRDMDIRVDDLPQELRAQGTTPDSAGGYTVPEGFSNEIAKYEAMWGPMLAPGVTRQIVTATGNPLPWPTVDDTANTGEDVAENAQANEQDVVFGEQVLNAYKHGSGIVRVSLELLQDSAFNMDSLLNELFGERLGRRSNAKLTTGSGTGEPNGIVTAAGAGPTTASGTAVTFDEVLALLHSVDPAYRGSPLARFMFNDNTLQALRVIKDGQGNYLWQGPDARSNEPATIYGYQYSVNQAMADIGLNARPIVFGDFNKYVVRRVRDYSIMRLSERYADFYQVGFLAFNRLDGELIDTTAVNALVNAAA